MKEKTKKAIRELGIENLLIDSTPCGDGEYNVEVVIGRDLGEEKLLEAEKIAAPNKVGVYHIKIPQGEGNSMENVPVYGVRCCEEEIVSTAKKLDELRKQFLI
ncbi:MAG: hypothetical protein ABIE55_01120 [Candidatus Aenigmatarchaeota archaeon]